MLIDKIRTNQRIKRGGQKKHFHLFADNQKSSLQGVMIPAAERTPSSIVARFENKELILEALEQLPPKYRDVLRLRYLHGLTIRQTAEELNKTFRSTEMLLYRALKKLRSSLDSSVAK